MGRLMRSPQPSLSPCAGAALYRRSVFTDVGLFDEDFFAYLEDIDWGFRAQLAGYTARYEPTAVSTTCAAPPPAGRREGSRRSNDATTCSWCSRTIRRPRCCATCRRCSGFQIVTLGASARDGLLAAHLRGFGEVALLLPRMLRKRRAIQRKRRVSVGELDALFSRAEIYAGTTLRERLGHRGCAHAPSTKRRHEKCSEPRHSAAARPPEKDRQSFTSPVRHSRRSP